MNKRMKASIKLSSSAFYFAGRDEAGARFKHHYLLQDYHELLQENKVKRERLQKALQRKLKLLAEVKFLSRKYQHLSNTPPTVQLRLKKLTQQISSPSIRVAQPHNLVIQTKLSLKDGNQKAEKDSAPSTTALLDLNQNIEQMEAFEADWKPLNVDNLKRFSRKGDMLTNDIKLSICRDIGSDTKSVGKRKVLLQDQMALRV